MVVGRQRDTKSIDVQISELIPELANRCFMFKMAESHRLRHFCGVDSVRGDARTLSLPVSVKLSANDLVDLYLAGTPTYSIVTGDILKYYDLLRRYLLLWAQRSHLLPDEAMPPIEEFTGIDDFLRSIHMDWYVQHVISGNKAPKEKGQFRSRRFSDSDLMKKENPLSRPSAYESVIDQFHQNVWRAT